MGRWVPMGVTALAGLSLVFLMFHPMAEAGHRGGRGGRSNVAAVQVRRGMLDATVQVMGTVQGVYAAAVASGVAGTLVSSSARVGQSVLAGQVLFTLSNPAALLLAQEAAAREQSASARYASALAGANPQALAQAQASLQIAQARLSGLFQPNTLAIEKQDYAVQQAQTAVTLADQAMTGFQNGQAPSVLALAAAQASLAAIESPQSSPQIEIQLAQATYDQLYLRGANRNALSQAQLQIAAAQAAYSSALLKAQQAVTAAQAAQSAALAKAQAALQAAEANLQAQQAQQAAVEAGPSSSAVEQARAGVALARARLAAVEHPLTNYEIEGLRAAEIGARSAALTAQRAAAGLVVRAPVSGIVTYVNPALGLPGAPVSATESLASIESPSVEVAAPVAQAESAGIRPGAPVALEGSAAPGREIAAHVVGISPTGNAANLTFLVSIAADSAASGLRAGEMATGTILKGRTQATLVPTAALETGANGMFVYVLERAAKAGAGGSTGSSATRKSVAGKVALANVRVGASDGDWTVVQSGLKPGQVVLIPGVGSYLAAGRRLRAKMEQLPAPPAFPISTTPVAPTGVVLGLPSGTAAAAGGAGAAAGNGGGAKAGGAGVIP